MTPNDVNSAGLLLDILGVWLVFRHGLPPPDARPDTLLMSKASGDAAAQAAKRHKRWATFGIALIVTGFLVQVVSNHWPA